MPLTHLNDRGEARMIDVGDKPVTARCATAAAEVHLSAETLQLLHEGMPKGDVLAVARVAGIMAAKRTAELIPLCHPISLDAVTVDLRIEDNPPRVEIAATVSTSGKTGVEMEALTAATVAALTVYDMCKSVERGIHIERVRLRHKSGGRSGETALP